MSKTLLRICVQVLLLIVFFVNISVNAQVFINEFQIESIPQIVELFNNGDSLIDISHWYIDDSGGTTFYTIPPNTLIYPHACISFTGDFNLNRTSADTVRLFNSLAPPTSPSAILLDSFSYKASSGSAVNFQRIPDTTQIWATAPASINLSNLTGQSCLILPTQTPTPSLTPTPDPPTPTNIPTISPTTTPILTNTPTPSLTPTPTAKPTSTPSSTPTPTNTPTPTPIPIEHVYLSEIYPFPQNDEAEWIEIYNDNEFEVKLNNWKIDDGASIGSAPKTFSLTIPGYGFAVYDLTSSLFNNTGDVIRLLNDNNVVINSTEYTTITSGNSFGRIDFLNSQFCIQLPSPSATNNPCIVIETTPTPTPIPTSTVHPTTSPTSGSQTTTTPTRTPTPIKTPTPTPTSTTVINYIYITEVLPNPSDGEDEWVELYNDNEFDVNLTDWYMDDIVDSGSASKKFSIHIPAYGYASIDFSSSIFNNDMDSVRLLSNSQLVVDQITYTESFDEYTINRNSIESDLVCFALRSKDQANNLCTIIHSSTPTPTPIPKPTSTPKVPTVTPTKSITPSLTTNPNPSITSGGKPYHTPDNRHEIKNAVKDIQGDILGELKKDREKKGTQPTMRTLSITSLIASCITIFVTIIRMRL